MSLSKRLDYRPDAWLSITDAQEVARDRVRGYLTDGTYAQEAVPCLCGVDSAKADLTIAERDRYGLPVTTVLCQACGLLRTNPRMTAEATAAFYQNDYRDLYTQAPPQQLWDDELRKGRDMAELIFGQMPIDIKSVYEVGCGAGGTLQAFAERGCEVAGCDYGEDYMCFAREKGLSLVEGDAHALLSSRGGEQADFVYMLHVMEHFVDLRAELHRVIDLVRPGGYLLVEVPGVRIIHTRYSSDILLYLQNAHNFHFTASTLRYTLESAGLEVQYCDEQAIAVARKGTHGFVMNRNTQPPPREAVEVMRYLASVEKTLLTDMAMEQRFGVR